MNRIAVMGCSGSGKSTLSGLLGEQLGVSVVHLDQLFWQPGWKASSHEHFAARVTAAVGQDQWILDGTFTSMQHIILPSAHTIIWLDFPRAICLWRIYKRLLAYHGRTRPDLPEGCPERFDFDFLEYVLTFRERVRPKIIARLAERRLDQRLFVLTGPAGVTRFLREMGIDR